MINALLCLGFIFFNFELLVTRRFRTCLGVVLVLGVLAVVLVFHVIVLSQV